jgi:leader peptidase (prepilin peptidase) / N-methyltransferase
MIDIKVEEAAGSEDDVYPNLAIMIGGAGAIGLISTLSLPGPVAVASTVLGTLMIAGAEVDARTFLLPDLVTLGAIICGILAAPLLDTTEPWTAVSETIARAGCIAGVLALFRAGYAWSRQTEGLGMGDVKLGGAIGAWLPLEAIPWCFGLATSGALLAVMFARLNGEPVMQTTKIPLGAFLCPALWIVFYADSVTR